MRERFNQCWAQDLHLPTAFRFASAKIENEFLFWSCARRSRHSVRCAGRFDASVVPCCAPNGKRLRLTAL